MIAGGLPRTVMAVGKAAKIYLLNLDPDTAPELRLYLPPNGIRYAALYSPYALKFNLNNQPSNCP